MLLCIDIGNSEIKFAAFEDSADNMLCSFSLSALTRRTADEYALLIKQLLKDKGVNGLPSNCCISSVVPSLAPIILAACKDICNKDPFVISAGTRTGFPIKIDVQTQLGADIVSNAAAAFNFVRPPFVIVDLGTATTITAVNADGQLIGTVIAPGATVSMDALSSSAALLTDVSFTKPEAIIGKNSQDSIRSGVFYGHIYMVDGFIRQLRDDICNDGQKLSLIGTGGLSGAILPYCRNKFELIPNLTLIGAASLFFHNTKNRTVNYTK